MLPLGAARMQTEIEDTKVICGLRLKPRKSAAKTLGKSEATLIRWELDGKGPPVTRIGRDVYYEESNLEKWVRSQAEVAA
jgi:predicted DNA-binding transcriptional regulator AlpA